EYPVFFYLLSERFPGEDRSFVPKWAPNEVMPVQSEIGEQQMRIRRIVSVFRKAAKLLRMALEKGAIKNRLGRPKKTDKPKDIIVIELLMIHHHYDSDGSIGNWDPADPIDRLLTVVKEKPVSRAAISRFFKRKFA